MPTAGKLFLYVEDLSFEMIKDALEDWSETTEYNDGLIETELITDITNAHLSDDEVTGILRADGVDTKSHRTGMKAIPYTASSQFMFFEQDGRKYVLIIAPKVTANNVANKLSMILHDEVGAVTVPKLNPLKLREFCEAGMAIKVLLFDEMDIPNMEKATLYGTNITQVNLYGKFVDSGQYRYSVTKLSKDGYTVGIVRDGSVCIFNTIEREDFIAFVKENIVPLVL